MSSVTRTVFARDPQTTTVLTRGESVGLVLDTLAGLVSALASTFVLARIFRRIWKNGWSSLEGLHVSIMALFVAELLQGTGQAMNIKWVIKGSSFTGPFCTAQGTISQIGEPYVALATMTIAFETFFIVWRTGSISGKISAYIMGFEFLFVVLFAAITFGIYTHPREDKYYAAPVPYWCWIGSSKTFVNQRIGGEYLWFWSTLIISGVLYVLLFLLYLGIIQKGTRWYMPKADKYTSSTSQRGTSNEDPHGVRHGAEDGPTSQDGSISGASTEVQRTVPSSRKNVKELLTVLYPIVYCFLILPLTITRWGPGFENKHRWSVLIGMSIFSLSGVVNALLYLWTRKSLFQSDEQADPRAPGIKLTKLRN